MNTVKLTIDGSNLDIEYHGSGLIPTASLNLDGNHDLRKLIAEMAEWCSRKVASTQLADPYQEIISTPIKERLAQAEPEHKEYRAWLHTAQDWRHIIGDELFHQLTARFHEIKLKGYSAQEALDHYPDPPPEPKPTLADFPNGLLGTWWSYLGTDQPNKVILHDGDSIELDSPTAVHGISLDWLFDAYTQVEAPAETGESRCLACGMTQPRSQNGTCSDAFCGGTTLPI